MFRKEKTAVLQVKHAWVVGVLLILAFVGSRAIPDASAQVALDCRGEIIDNQCVTFEEDVCWNIDDIQTEVPKGYHIDASQNNACVEDTPAPSSGEVLGAEVLAESTGK